MGEIKRKTGKRIHMEGANSKKEQARKIVCRYINGNMRGNRSGEGKKQK